MEITWSGHSCFTLRGKETTLLLDPCPRDCGCITRWGSPSAVVISHRHPGHSCISEVTGTPRIFDGPGEYEVGGAFITGISTFHDSEEGAVRGKNTLYVIEMEGLTLCHTGDLGHPLSSHTLREIGKVDILFVPVGDVTTLSVAEARALVRAIQPKYVLPMHFRTETARPELEPLETFLTAMGTPQPETRAKLLATATNLPLNMQVLPLTCDSRAG
jgi:L-ascorbate metabolism protein UlaG (beta-lactamase superfamily)